MNYRKWSAFTKRQEANQLATDRPHPRHISNGDEQKFRHPFDPKLCEPCQKGADPKSGKPSYLMSFTKGMPHDHLTGLVKDPDVYPYFVAAIDSGHFRDFRDVPLGPDAHCGSVHACECTENSWKSSKAKNCGCPVGVRAWESQGAGLAFDLEGPDAQSVTMPPAPKLGSPELEGEMGEVYAQAVLRDVPFNAFSAGVVCSKKVSSKTDLDALETTPDDVDKVKSVTDKLNKLDWFSSKEIEHLGPQEIKRRRKDLTPSSAFRGITPGDEIGPYLSQFLLIGTKGLNSGARIKEDKDCTGPIGPERKLFDGYIDYGAVSVDQRVRKAIEKKNYMTNWDEWLDVQHAADLGGFEEYDQGQMRRFIYTPRDIATYVHYDALYEAYLNACLILLALKVPFDPGVPFQEPNNRDHQQGFAHFGGPHILSLVTEVATRALKAVRFQKFNIHRRLRPEALAARVHRADELNKIAPELSTMRNNLENAGILNDVRPLNDNGELLLPMAFCEGSPMHPAYGAGHATVAGACVTLLKAFFDHKHALNILQCGEKPQREVVNLIKRKYGKGFKEEHIMPCNVAYVSVQNGTKLDLIPVFDQECKLACLTVEGELNKLASNISIGRDWAGVHYFTDYYESLLMGEQIALGLLEEQKLMYNENFSMTVPLFNGDSIRI